jgi:misacylated tRNA(Ala) deacylase
MRVKLYLEDSYLREFHAEVVASADGWCALSQTAFYPGGGGQPADRGRLVVGGEALAVDEVREDAAGEIWHHTGRELGQGLAVDGELEWGWRYALMRAHALMHVVNTVARDQYGGVITGVQLGAERSRIDFKLPQFAREQIPAFEERVNGVLSRQLPIASSTISEEEFRGRPDLVRTLDVAPPVIAGRVRVVEIAGFDAQACGGTHVHSTAEVGRARVVKFDNKGRDNKRFYWELAVA